MLPIKINFKPMKYLFFLLLLLNFKTNSQILISESKDLKFTEHPELLFFENGNLKFIEKSKLEKNIYSFNLPKKNGLYEITIGNLGKIPLVYNGQKKIVLQPSLTEINNYEVLGKDKENFALKMFQKTYQNYLGSFEGLEEELKLNWPSKNKKEVVTTFVKNYASLRELIGKEFKNIENEYPNTYTSKYLTKYLNYIPAPNNEDLLNFYRNNFFSNWDLSKQEALNNPMLLHEIKKYLIFFASNNGSIYNGLNSIMTQKDLVKNKEIKQIIIELLSIEIYNLQFPKREEYINYLNENFLALCTDHSDENLSNNLNFSVRIKNMNIGNKFPVMNLQLLNSSANEKTISTNINDRNTMLYFWKSTCDYCKATVQNIEEYAKKNKDNLTVIAVSLDKDKENLIGYLKYLKEVEKRDRPNNWVECWESQGYDSDELKKIYIDGTPLYILLDKNGIVQFKGHNLDQIKEL